MNVTRTNCIFPIADFNSVKLKMLNWINRFSIFCFLDNHNYQIPPFSEECLAGAGSRKYFSSAPDSRLEEFQQFLDLHTGGLFGHFSYDLKNKLEGIEMEKIRPVKFPDIFFFEPEIVIRLNREAMIIEGTDFPEKIFREISDEPMVAEDSNTETRPGFRQRVSKAEYLETVKKLKGHILQGDCYEINYCQEFFHEGLRIDPAGVYKKLSEISPNPFSAFYRVNDQYLICASPERYLKKLGDQLISQPIKGTASRFVSNTQKDRESREQLFQSKKDRSENVMVVDLVRNDLSKICIKNSVKVDELFGVYSFPQVHQMISTISGRLRKEVNFSEIIRATFPMGSMTGAPKKRVMELIDQYEKTARGIFSGALGYILPAEAGSAGPGDFDFNVVIRSIIYDQSRQYVSFPAGSGITFYSDPEKEYEECLLKAGAMIRALS